MTLRAGLSEAETSDAESRGSRNSRGLSSWRRPGSSRIAKLGRAEPPARPTTRWGTSRIALESATTTTGRLSWFGNAANTVPHDDNGNVEHIDGVDIGWSALDKVRSLTTSEGTTSFMYDAGGARTLRYGKAGYTMTLGGLFELSNKANDQGGIDLDARYFVPVGGAVVEVRDQIADVDPAWDRQVLYQYNDHLGSGSILVDEDGNVDQAVSYGPWGEAREWDDWSQTVDPAVLQTLASGFTGHQPELDTGLINMRGRMYSPVLGRFLGVDPVVEDPADAQTWNAYSYVLNNPLRYVDPTGLAKLKAGECTEWEKSSDGAAWRKTCRDGESSGDDAGPSSDHTDPTPLPGGNNSGDAGGGGGKSGAGGSSSRPNGPGQGGPVKLDYTALSVKPRLPHVPNAQVYQRRGVSHELEVVANPNYAVGEASTQFLKPTLHPVGDMLVLFLHFRLEVASGLLGETKFGVVTHGSGKTVREHETNHLRIKQLALRTELHYQQVHLNAAMKVSEVVRIVTEALVASMRVAQFVDDKFDVRTEHNNDSPGAARRFARDGRILREIEHARGLSSGTFGRRAARWRRRSEAARLRAQKQEVRQTKLSDYIPEVK